MGRFAEQYSAAQKAAVAVAVVDGEKVYGRKIVPREAVRMAAAGELHEIGPFEISLPTVQKAATRLRHERAGKAISWKRERGTVDERLEALTAQRLRILEYEQDRIEAKAKRRELTAEDLERVKRCGLAEREIRARAITPAARTGTKARTETPKDPDPTGGKSDLVKSLEREAKRRQHQDGDDTTGNKAASASSDAANHEAANDTAREGDAHVPEPSSVGELAPA